MAKGGKSEMFVSRAATDYLYSHVLGDEGPFTGFLILCKSNK